jgi:DNA-binding CsgD family transcriptional regulator
VRFALVAEGNIFFYRAAFYFDSDPRRRAASADKGGNGKMKHLIVLYYTLAFASGVVGIVVSIMLYMKTQLRALIAFIAFLSFLFLLVLSNSVYYYVFKIAQVESVNLEILFAILFFVCFGEMIYLLGYLVNYLVGKKWAGIKRVIFSGLALIPAVLIIVPIFVSQDSAQTLAVYWTELYSFYIYLFYGVILYAIALMGMNLFKEIDALRKKILQTVFILSVTCLPLFLIDGLWKYFQESWHLLPRFVTLTPVFFIFWNLFLTVYGAEVLINSEKVIRSFKGIPESFSSKYGISAREREVLEMAARGITYRKIAERLNIAVGTVKNHCKSIYQKTGVNNKLSLLLLAQREGE